MSLYLSLFHWCDWLTLTLTDWLTGWKSIWLVARLLSNARVCDSHTVTHCDTLCDSNRSAICTNQQSLQYVWPWQSSWQHCGRAVRWILFIYASLSGHWGRSSFRRFLITVDYFSHKSAIVRLTVLDFQSRAQKFHPSWKNQSGLKFSLKYCSWRVGASLENPPLRFWVGSASTIYHDHPPLPNMEKM